MQKNKNTIIKEKPRRISIWHFLLPYVPFALPILYLSATSTEITELYRAASIMVFGLFAVWLLLSRNTTTFKKLAYWQLAALALVVVMVVSCALSYDKIIGLIGINSDYQGLLVQLSSFAIGYYAAKQVNFKNYWRNASIITGMVCIASIAADIPYILADYRESGLVLHATGMGLYAALCLGINLSLLCSKNLSQRWRIWHSIAIFSVIVTLLLSASRIALLATIIIVFMYFILLKPYRMRIAFVGISLVLASVIGGKLIPTSGRLTNADRVEGGITYRLDLYKWSIAQSQVTLIGAGPSQIADVLASDRAPAPPLIQKTLDDGFAFWYSHNQFIDFYIAYGVIGFSLFIMLITTGYLRLLNYMRKSRDDHSLQLACIVIAVAIVAGAHLLVNTPSLELAALVWMSIFSLLQLRPTKQQDHWRTVISISENN